MVGGTLVLSSPARLRPGLLVVGCFGWLLTVGALLGLPSLAWAIVAFGAQYAMAVAGAHTIDARAPLVGAGLLLLGELVAWSLEYRQPVREERGLRLQRATSLLTIALGSVVAGSVVLAAASVTSGGPVLEAAGAAAAVGALAMVAGLSRRLARPGRSEPP